MRRGRRQIPDSVRRAVERQHPDAFNVPESKPFERTVSEPVQLVGNGAPRFGKQRKYRNEPVTDEDTGETFDSKLEHRIWKALVARYGQRNVMRQVSIMLPGRVRMKPDFIILGETEDGRRTIERIIDAKGMAPTRDWTNKAKQLRAEFKLPVEVVKKPSEI